MEQSRNTIQLDESAGFKTCAKFHILFTFEAIDLDNCGSYLLPYTMNYVIEVSSSTSYFSLAPYS
jgi:hypothetical protein